MNTTKNMRARVAELYGQWLRLEGVFRSDQMFLGYPGKYQAVVAHLPLRASPDPLVRRYQQSKKLVMYANP